MFVCLRHGISDNFCEKLHLLPQFLSQKLCQPLHLTAQAAQNNTFKIHIPISGNIIVHNTGNISHQIPKALCHFTFYRIRLLPDLAVQGRIDPFFL